MAAISHGMDFEHTTPEQRTCFGVPLETFWTEETILAKLRYPKWDMSEYMLKMRLWKKNLTFI